jgi:hypothetical protein
MYGLMGRIELDKNVTSHFLQRRKAGRRRQRFEEKRKKKKVERKRALETI